MINRSMNKSNCHWDLVVWTALWCSNLLYQCEEHILQRNPENNLEKLFGKISTTESNIFGFKQ